MFSRVFEQICINMYLYILLEMYCTSNPIYWSVVANSVGILKKIFGGYEPSRNRVGVPARQATQPDGICSLESILWHLISLKIRAQKDDLRVLVTNSSFIAWYECRLNCCVFILDRWALNIHGIATVLTHPRKTTSLFSFSIQKEDNQGTFAIYAKKEEEYFCLILFYEEHKHNSLTVHTSCFCVVI